MNRRGQAGELLAAEFLQRQGLRVLQRNYLCRMGEIDLVCADAEVLVFVEVRQRSSDRYGGAAASITAAKQARLQAAARHYLMRLGRFPPCRFDVILVSGKQQHVEWLRSAFEA